MHELLTPDQMAMADKLAIEAGCPGIELMENAGAGLHESFSANFAEAKTVLVVCGTGNNGGDGFVLARRLVDSGIDARVHVHGDITRIVGDAELALAKLDRKLLLADLPDLSQFDVIVDALLGAGLDRDVEGRLSTLIETINSSGKPVLAVDLPSGIDGRTGHVRGCAVKANVTTTFFRLKPGHVLAPGRQTCGTVELKQIGIGEQVLDATGNVATLNTADLWSKHYPFPAGNIHKYDRGHTLVVSGPAHATGASRLAAQAALRCGSGLVTLASPTDALAINAGHLTSVMLKLADTPDQIVDLLGDKRFNCVALGPGLEPNEHTRAMVLAVLQAGRTTVLDAGALTAFQGQPDVLFDAIKSAGIPVFMTPHEGEFNRLFPFAEPHLSKIECAKMAASHSGATMVLKGAETVVATVQGAVSVCNHAPPWLATAGSGDVLTGIVAGLAAQDMQALECASAAVWLHAEAANIAGGGMVSSDLDSGLRLAIKNLIVDHTSDRTI